MPSFSGGFATGYNVVASAKERSAKREERAKVASDEADLRKEKLKQAGFATGIAESKDAGMKQLNTTMQDNISRMNKIEGKELSMYSNEFVTSTDPEVREQNLKRLKDNASPGVLSKMGIKDIGTASTLNQANTQDVKELRAHFIKEGVDAAALTDGVMGQAVESGTFIKVDGTIVDMSAFTKLSGGFSRMTPEQQKVFEDKNETLLTTFNQQVADNQMQDDLKVAAEKDKLKLAIEKQATQLSGLPAQRDPADTRSTMGKEMDDLAADFPELSEEEIFQKWKGAKATKKASTSQSQQGIVWAARTIETLKNKKDLTGNEKADLRAATAIMVDKEQTASEQNVAAAGRLIQPKPGQKLSSTDISTNYRTASVNPAKGQKLQQADSLTTGNLERSDTAIKRIEADIKSGKLKTGMAVTSWNKMINKLPFDGSALTSGDRDSFANALADVTGMTIDAAADISGVLSNQDMEMVRETVGSGGTLNADVMLGLVQRFQQKRVNQALDKMPGEHQQPYADRLRAIKYDAAPTAVGTAEDYANKKSGVIFTNRAGQKFHFVDGKAQQVKG